MQDAAPASYDVIIVDSSDPDGPASVLFTKEFFANVHRALRPGGIACTQGECAWLHLPLIKGMTDLFREVRCLAAVKPALTDWLRYSRAEL